MIATLISIAVDANINHKVTKGFAVMLIRGPFRHFSQIITIFGLVLDGCETNGTFQLDCSHQSRKIASLVMIVVTVETALILSVW